MSLAARINAQLGGRYYVDAPTAAAEHHRAELARALARRNPTEVYVVCPSTKMPVCLGEFSHRCHERRPCPSCSDAHSVPHLHGDRSDNLRALQRVMPVFVDQAANDVRDPEVAVGAARFMAHEAIRLRRGHAMDFAKHPLDSHHLYANAFTPAPHLAREGDA